MSGPADNPAVRYVLQQVAAWESLPTRLSRLEQQAVTVRQAGQQVGDHVTVASMGAVLAGTGELRTQVAETAPMIGQVLTAVNAQALDTATVGVALRLELTMAAGLTSADQLANAVATGAAQVLTPDERAQLGVAAPAASGGGLVAWLAVGAGVWLAVRALRRRKGAR